MFTNWQADLSLKYMLYFIGKKVTGSYNQHIEKCQSIEEYASFIIESDVRKEDETEFCKSSRWGSWYKFMYD